MATILIVEDEVSQRKVLSDSLRQQGYEVLEAADGAAGLTMALQAHPDIILLDVRMPNMDGMAMMHKLREDAWGKHVSIIILTNYDTSEAQLLQVATDLPSYYLMKANSSLDSILEKIETELRAKKKPNNQPAVN
jgi:CheY-like chemotaxis protein